MGQILQHHHRPHKRGGPVTARLRPGYGPVTARLRPGYGPVTARLRPGYGPVTARLRPGYGPVTARLRPGYGQCRVGRRHWEWLLRVYSTQQIGFGRHNIFNVAGEFLKLVSESADEPTG